MNFGFHRNLLFVCTKISLSCETWISIAVKPDPPYVNLPYFIFCWTWRNFLVSSTSPQRHTATHIRCRQHTYLVGLSKHTRFIYVVFCLYLTSSPWWICFLTTTDKNYHFFVWIVIQSSFIFIPFIHKFCLFSIWSDEFYFNKTRTKKKKYEKYGRAWVMFVRYNIYISYGSVSKVAHLSNSCYIAMTRIA